MIAIHYTALGGDACVEVPLPSCFVPNDENLLVDTIVQNTHTQSGPFWDLIKDSLPDERTHTEILVGDQITVGNLVYHYERDGWRVSSPLMDYIDEAVASGRVAYTAYAVWGDHERASLHAFTNDDFDTGMPSSYAEWDLDFTAREGRTALEQVAHHTGVSRVTPGGVVSVYVNGMAVVND